MSDATEWRAEAERLRAELDALRGLLTVPTLSDALEALWARGVIAMPKHPTEDVATMLRSVLLDRRGASTKVPPDGSSTQDGEKRA